MQKSLFFSLFFLIPTISYSQQSQIKFFNNEWLETEVAEGKGKYSQIITNNADGTVTTDIKWLKKDEIVRSETYKGNEPYGTWKFKRGEGYAYLNYNFLLVYMNEKCEDSLLFITDDYFKDIDSLGYKAPVIKSGEAGLIPFLVRNVYYPAKARESNVQGTIYLQMTLGTEGTENVVIKRGVDVLLDKEAARVLRELKFSTPPMINGKPIILKCLVLPVKFRLL